MSNPKTRHAAIPQIHNTELACHSDTATVVFLAGSFNGWSTTSTPMKKSQDGEWSASLPLAAGRYEYKFVVDGEWCCEPGSTSETVHGRECIMNEFGTMNRVLEV